jgi:NADPH:quinone reductase-like Zn-dependent oxidoreductase
MADTMRAAQYDRFGSAEVLKVRDLPVPTLRNGYVLVKVTATAIEGVDINSRSGKLKLIVRGPFPRGAGHSFTGEVVRSAPDVTEYVAGERVWGSLPPASVKQVGAAAEYVAAPIRNLAHLPDTLDPEQAAGLTGVAPAAIQALRHRAQLKAGERVLVRGAAGGLGAVMVQYAHALGADVVGLAAAKDLDGVRTLGADDVYDYRQVDIKALGKFDVIVDCVGDQLRAYRRLLAQGGRMMEMAASKPAELAYVAFSIVHGTRRVRFLPVPPTRVLLDEVSLALEAGQFRPVVDKVFDLEDIADAHRAQESRVGFGRHIVRI